MFLQRKTQQDARVYQNFIIPYFKWGSTCFGWHTAHRQEPNCTSSLWFCIISWKVVGHAVLGCCRVATWQHPRTAYPTTFHDIMQKQRLLVQLSSWRWAVCRPKHVEPHLKKGIIKFWYTVASCWVFPCKNCIMMHRSTNIKFINYVCSKPRTGHKCLSGKPLGCSLLTQIINSTNVTILSYKSFF